MEQTCTFTFATWIERVFEYERKVLQFPHNIPFSFSIYKRSQQYKLASYRTANSSTTVEATKVNHSSVTAGTNIQVSNFCNTRKAIREYLYLYIIFPFIIFRANTTKHLWEIREAVKLKDNMFYTAIMRNPMMIMLMLEISCIPISTVWMTLSH